MLAVSKSQRQAKPRSQIELNPIKLSNFLFKKQAQQQNSMRRQNNASLRIRFKSQISTSNQEENEQANLDRFNLGRNRHSSKQSLSVDLTSRILKWNHIRYHNDQEGIKKNKLKVFSTFKKKSLNLERSQMLVQNNRSFRMKGHENGLDNKNREYGRGEPDSHKIIQNYKQTQRVVYFEQLQQRKDKQRQLQYQHIKQDNKNQIHYRTNSNQIQSIVPKEQTVAKSGNEEEYRPWSGGRTKERDQDEHPQLIQSRVQTLFQQIQQLIE